MDLNIAIEEPAKCGALYGATDVNLRSIRAAFDVRIAARDGLIHLSGATEAVRKAADAIGHLQKKLRTASQLSEDDIAEAIALSSDRSNSMADGRIEVFAKNARIVPKTEGQARYVEAIINNDATFCLGPAGSGKTYIAVALALTMLKRKQIEKIILARPAVEAGEKLGYLPGDLQAKVNPYLRPLFDALHDMMGFDQSKRFMENEIIEVIPLAFMRGRTLNKSMIILDEAQNTTVAQMLMVLTRMGLESKLIVTADDSQIDLPPGQPSGVLDAVRRLGHVEGIAVVRLEKTDIVRHRLVQEIVDAYAGDKVKHR
ncbi:MAG: PhoH family protein [Phycisphaerae bacterium]